MAFDTVQTDPDICSNCFRRIYDRYERNYRVDATRTGVEIVDVGALEITLPNGDTEEVGGMDDMVTRRHEDTMKIPERGGHRGLRTVCKCGFRYQPDEDWKNRPLDKATFFEYAQRLAERFRENGVSFNESAFFDRLDELKSDPDFRFADDRIFALAIDHASTIETVRKTADA